ncbi:MAG: Stf0 family sulfotransferase [Pseudomonadota bacterium]
MTAPGRIIRACFEARLVDKIGRDMALPDAQADLSAAPDRIMLMLVAARSGSTYAGQLLSRTGHFVRIADSLNPEQLAAVRAEHGLADDGEALRWMIGQRGTRTAFGAKCGEPGLISAWYLGFLDAVLDRATLLHIERRDTVAQAVSLFRARLSGRYHSPGKAKRIVTAEDYNRAAIATDIQIIEQVNANLADFVKRTKRPCLHFYYEDICAAPRAFVDTVCARLDLPVPREFDGKVRVKILRDELNAEWVQRFRSGD